MFNKKFDCHFPIRATPAQSFEVNQVKTIIAHHSMQELLIYVLLSRKSKKY
jgi:hypothetical protein